MNPTITWERKPLFGVPIDGLTLAQVLDLIDETIRARGRLLIGVVNVAKLVNMRRDALLRDSVLSSDVVLADGVPVVWAMRLLRRRVPERIAGVDLMTAMLERGNTKGHRVYCLGATDEISRITVERFGEQYPGVRIVGRRDGYFKKEDEPQVAAEIKAAGADILFVAMSPPKKEQFLARWFEEMGVPVCHGVGGAFDVMAGKVKRAPELWQRVGMEWFYRVLQEPRRMWKRYLVTNTLFCWMMMGELLRRDRGTKGHGDGGATRNAESLKRGESIHR
ncbi:MAG: WecB/TagA/CpsF family glycosyltransferase [Phycisphaerales bacterium]|nr:WecB/TagA/CpsF family glycosyltransferase [Phycisphaerales bacterium]